MSAPNSTESIAADTAVVRALRRIRVPQTQRNRELFLLIFAFVDQRGGASRSCSSARSARSTGPS